MKFPTITLQGAVLSSWLTVVGYSQSQLADELGVTKGRVSQLLNSTQEPSAHLIAKLVLLTGIPFERLFKIVPAIRNSVPSFYFGKPNGKTNSVSLRRAKKNNGHRFAAAQRAPK